MTGNLGLPRCRRSLPAGLVLAGAALALVAASAAPSVPPVLLTKQHQSLCRIGVGDVMPPIELAQTSGRRTKLADLYGRAATVVVFWKSDRRMSLAELADLGPDVVEPFGDQGVAVIGIAVGESARSAPGVLRAARATFPNLLDANGQAFAKVGSEKLPRTYVLDSQGKVLWLDIEYSLATRRELNQTLQAIVGSK
jgi:peroxiredoxin